jgi:transcriptional regulator with XRE-family HTH domain
MHSRAAKLCRARLIKLLKTERKKSGLLQVDLAKRMRRSQTWVAHLETGKRRYIDICDFLTMAEIIGFDPIELLGIIIRIRAPKVRQAQSARQRSARRSQQVTPPAL